MLLPNLKIICISYTVKNVVSASII